MTDAALVDPRSHPRLHLRPVVAVGVLAASIDLAFASLWWALAAGITPMRILQSIAAGVLGRASFQDGWRSALLGAVLHYAIATAMVAIYALAAARVPGLALRPWRWGPVYGLALYATMTFVVVPLSAATPARHNPGWMLASIAMHVVIGVLCAYAARRSVRS